MPVRSSSCRRPLTVATLAAAALLTAGCGPASSGASSGPGSSGSPAAGAVSGSAARAAGSSPTAPPAAAASACQLGDGLKVATREGNATAGSAYVTIVFTNTASAPCRIEGYPGVSFVSSGGQQLGAAATRVPAAAPAQFVTLPAGGSASANLQVGDPDALDCTTQAPASLRVYPPGETTSVDLAYDRYPACQDASVRQLSIYPVAPGSGR